MLKDMVTVKYSVGGSSLKVAEEQAWVHFGDFLDECEGKKLYMYIILLVTVLVFSRS